MALSIGGTYESAVDSLKRTYWTPTRIWVQTVRSDSSNETGAALPLPLRGDTDGRGRARRTSAADDLHREGALTMDFSLTVDQELLIESIQEFAERYFDEDTVNAMY